MEVLAVLVLVLVFGPPVVLVPALLMLCGVGLFVSERSRHGRSTFACPATGRTVTADFSVPAGAGRPNSVISCSAFRDPSHVTCAQHCLELAGVRWSPPVSLFGRWALTSSGVVGFGDADRSEATAVAKTAA